MTLPGDPFDQAIDELLDREFEESPRMAAGMGRDGFDHRLDDLSADGFARRHADDLAWVQRFRAFDPGTLDAEQSVDRSLVVAELDRRVALDDWQGWRRSPEAYLETGITELFLLAMRSEDELTEGAVARLEGIGAVLAQAEDNLDPVLANRVIVDRGLAECMANIEFARDQVALLADASGNRERLAAAGETAARAYETFASFLAELAPRCTGSFVFGEERYNDVLRRGELFDLDVRELRAMGWDEYHRVAEAMAEAAARLPAGSTDWREAVRRLQTVHPDTVEGMRAAYEAVCQEARLFMTAAGLVTNPPDEHCHVMPAPPPVRATLAVACYYAPPMFKPSRDGYFFVPFPVDADDPEEVGGLLESNATYAMATTAVHEAYPGHHWHLMTIKEARPIRRVFTSTYFTEGWALYAESMMRDAGFFTPEQEIGFLEARLFRAARIVVDTSLHTGEMTVEEAQAFMHDKALVPVPTARSEVARYCAWPTQASSYLTGSLAIERARDDWLDGGGGLRTFHDALARSGAMPVPLAVEAIGPPRADG